MAAPLSQILKEIHGSDDDDDVFVREEKSSSDSDDEVCCLVERKSTDTFSVLKKSPSCRVFLAMKNYISPLMEYSRKEHDTWLTPMIAWAHLASFLKYCLPSKKIIIIDPFLV